MNATAEKKCYLRKGKVDTDEVNQCSLTDTLREVIRSEDSGDDEGAYRSGKVRVSEATSLTSGNSEARQGDLRPATA
jgi:hypothetical protein